MEWSRYSNPYARKPHAKSQGVRALDVAVIRLAARVAPVYCVTPLEEGQGHRETLRGLPAVRHSEHLTEAGERFAARTR